MIRAAVFVGSGALVVASFVFTTVTVNRLSQEIATTSGVLARLCAQASFPAARNFELEQILSDVISQIDFPIVITDNDSLPRAWRNVGIDPILVPDSLVDSLGAGRHVPAVIRGRIAALKARAAELDRSHAPIPMLQPILHRRVGDLHYGDPLILERLRVLPYVSVGGLLLLLSLGWWGLTGIRRAERRSIWVGMALETAHQLGTPLSSLMGWVERLRSQAETAGADEVRLSRAELTETVDEMERDVDRLRKVAQRFSHVGSAPRLETQDVTRVVQQAVEYSRRRLPQREGEVLIEERYAEVPLLPCNRQLLEWVIENLLSNAASALDKRPGKIAVVVSPSAERDGVEIEVRDNGRGMSPTEQRRAFEPGYTTNRRGWGLGLALSRRVVEEYHGGRLFIRRSIPGEGTVVVIVLHR
jgi:two-component system, NtrC family, sensor histidine kinase KinB